MWRQWQQKDSRLGAPPQKGHLLSRLNIAVTFGQLLTFLSAIIETDNNNLNQQILGVKIKRMK